MSAYEESNMSEAARRAYEAARRAFSNAPSVPAHGWRGTLETCAAAATAADDGATGAGAPAAEAAEDSSTAAVVAPATEAPATDDATGAGAAAMPQMSPGPAAPAPSGTLRERIDAARAKQAGSVPAPKSASGPASAGTPGAPGAPDSASAGAFTSASAGAPNPFARAENEDDDGYDPWSDRREEPSFWEEDPWR